MHIIYLLQTYAQKTWLIAFCKTYYKRKGVLILFPRILLLRNFYIIIHEPETKMRFPFAIIVNTRITVSGECFSYQCTSSRLRPYFDIWIDGLIRFFVTATPVSAEFLHTLYLYFYLYNIYLIFYNLPYAYIICYI